MSSKEKTIGMKEGGKPTLVPKLRFPEFQGIAGWHSYLLEELEELGWVELGRGEVISGQDVKEIPGDYPIYSSSVKNNGLMGTYGRFMFDEELISWSIDGGGDFFYRPRHKFSVTNVSGYMRLSSSNLNYRFLAGYLQALHRSLVFDYQFKAHPSVIRKLYRLAVPSLTEQQKIADCLTSLDEAITAQARKVDALKRHKKGLMQQLFPREGETKPCLPERRFPEFRNEAMWHPSELGSLAIILKGKGISKADLDPNGSQPCIRYGELYTRYGEIISKVISRTKVPRSQLFFSEPNDVIIPSSGETKIDIAKASCVLAGGIALGGDLNVIRTKLNGIFLSYYLNGPKRLDIAKVAQGDTVVHLYPHQLEALHIAVPSIAEQQRIASCLSSLDSLISAEIQKFDTLKIHKKSLLQQLFPPSKEAEK